MAESAILAVPRIFELTPGEIPVNLISMNENVNIDQIRLDAISNPKFVFNYSVAQNGQITLREPMAGIFPNLRSAIDYARCCIGEVPFCIKCKSPLNETNNYGNKRRFYCPKCETAFNI